MPSHIYGENTASIKLVKGWSKSADEHREEAKLGLDDGKPRLVIEKSHMSAEQDIKTVLLMTDETYESVRKYGHRKNEALAKLIEKENEYDWIGEIPEIIKSSITSFSGGRSEETYVEIRYADSNGNTPYERLHKKGETGLDAFLASQNIKDWVDLVKDRWLCQNKQSN